MRIYHLDESSWSAEPAYNAVAKRFFPWDGIASRSWGGAWVKVLPGELLTPHNHDENEVFFVVQGSGLLTHGDEQHRVAFGSSMYMEPDTTHSLLNDGEEDLVFVSVWWDGEVALPSEPAP
ncbi:MAG TPA: cupin domain-containing protein [Jatrophihabitans sp.]|nr:cupin domain-containing protein [Jatrophihabitans sp.]